MLHAMGKFEVISMNKNAFSTYIDDPKDIIYYDLDDTLDSGFFIE
jgi:hypothetical protein